VKLAESVETRRKSAEKTAKVDAAAAAQAKAGEEKPPTGPPKDEAPSSAPGAAQAGIDAMVRMADGIVRALNALNMTDSKYAGAVQSMRGAAAKIADMVGALKASGLSSSAVDKITAALKEVSDLIAKAMTAAIGGETEAVNNIFNDINIAIGRVAAAIIEAAGNALSARLPALDITKLNESVKALREALSGRGAAIGAGRVALLLDVAGALANETKKSGFNAETAEVVNRSIGQLSSAAYDVNPRVTVSVYGADGKPAAPRTTTLPLGDYTLLSGRAAAQRALVNSIRDKVTGRMVPPQAAQVYNMWLDEESPGAKEMELAYRSSGVHAEQIRIGVNATDKEIEDIVDRMAAASTTGQSRNFVILAPGKELVGERIRQMAQEKKVKNVLVAVADKGLTWQEATSYFFYNVIDPEKWDGLTKRGVEAIKKHGTTLTATTSGQAETQTDNQFLADLESELAY
jgi:hypothetical protein